MQVYHVSWPTKMFPSSSRRREEGSKGVSWCQLRRAETDGVDLDLDLQRLTEGEKRLPPKLQTSQAQLRLQNDAGTETVTVFHSLLQLYFF